MKSISVWIRPRPVNCSIMGRNIFLLFVSRNKNQGSFRQGLSPFANGRRRRIAASQRRLESHSTLGATALVHEAWLRLKDSPHLALTSPHHFKRIAARVIRQVLVEAARGRNALKRGGPEAIRLPLDDLPIGGVDCTLELLQVDELLSRLTMMDSWQAQLAEIKIFSKLTNTEIASEFDVSLSKVERDWRVTKAWLKAQIDRGH